MQALRRALGAGVARRDARASAAPHNRALAWPGAAFAIASAALFGASTPVAKLLLQEGLNPQLLAGLFYLGSGVGLTLVLLVRRRLRPVAGEARLRRADLPLLSMAVLLGGAVAPVLMMYGLERTSAASAALLQNLEGLATMGLAWLVYRENVDRRLLLGALAILAGAALLSIVPGTGQALAAAGGAGGSAGGTHPTSGALLIAAACLCWGADNNLTRKISAADPMQIAGVKGLAAGTANLALALAVGAAAPTFAAAGIAAAVGFLGYGVSLVLFVLGLRHLGAARTAAYYSTAPFIGALLSLLVFPMALGARLLIAGGLMAVGVVLHLREHHQHVHHHELLEHEHRHTHDEHHQHEHLGSEPPGEPHSHRHRHEPLTHEHPHYPDLHHLHDH